MGLKYQEGEAVTTIVAPTNFTQNITAFNLTLSDNSTEVNANASNNASAAQAENLEDKDSKNATQNESSNSLTQNITSQ